MTNTIEALETAKLHHATKKKAVGIIEALETSYPQVSLQIETDDMDRVSEWLAVFETEEGEEVVCGTWTEKCPDLADVLDAVVDKGFDPEEGFEEEAMPGGSVVAAHYRQQYREQSTSKQSCGDWLAEWLDERCLMVDGKKAAFDLEEFDAILHANSVDTIGKWYALKDSPVRGAPGRFRMNGRQKLEKEVAYAGAVFDAQGGKHDLPSEALSILQAKHAKWIAKRTKAEAAAKAE